MAKELGKIIADFQTSLAGKIAIGGTTGSLLSVTDDDGVILPDGRYFFTIDSDNSLKEHISCDLVGATKTITNIKTVARGTGVETAGTLREHRTGATVTITDFAHIKKLNDLLDGTTDLDADNPLKYDADPTITDDKHLATKKYIDDVAIAGGANASSTVKGIAKLSTDPASPTEPIAVGDNDARVPPIDTSTMTAGQVAALAGTSGTPSATNKFITDDDTSETSDASKIVRAGVDGKIDNSWLNTSFGGTGVDGALNISSGTTTIDLGGAAVFIKNYSSISITGTGKLAFSNPHANGTTIFLKSQGDITLTSITVPNIDASGLGAEGGGGTYGTNCGTGGGAGGSSVINDGSNGAAGGSYATYGSSSGRAGKGTGKTGGGEGGKGNTGTSAGGVSFGYGFSSIITKPIVLIPGAGGGSGSGSNEPGGSGGRGGGAMLIECGGHLNFTGTIHAKGNNGSDAPDNGWTSGGGGGGGGGQVILLYNLLTSKSGIITTTGGAGGAKHGDAANGAAGGNGYSLVAKNPEY